MVQSARRIFDNVRRRLRAAAANGAMFNSVRDARLYLASFFFVHTTVPFVFPTLLNPSSSNASWLVVLMVIYVPAFGAAIMGIRYLPRQARWPFTREKTVYSKAVEQGDVSGSYWNLAFYGSRVAVWAALAVLLLRVQDFGLL